MSAFADTLDQPTVVLRIANSMIAFETTGEILETVEYLEDGTPDWSKAGVCDHRGGGGSQGYDDLGVALTRAEHNATLLGYEIVRVQGPS